MADSRRRPPPRPAPRPLARPAPAPREEQRRIATPPRPAAPGGVRVVTGSMFIDTSKGPAWSGADRPRPAGPEPVERSSGSHPGAGRELRAPPPPALGAREFRSDLQRLLREYEGEQDNPGSISCEGCRRCESCMFCVDCEECYRCTHSHGCRSSSHLTHCVDCVGCHDCAYCVQSENCTRSNYLVLSRNCSECSYCFGCVGLSKKDFHILNVKYTRSEYFRIVKSLQAELGLPER